MASSAADEAAAALRDFLAPLPEEEQRAYFARLTAAAPGLEVRRCEGKGRGLFATAPFAEGDVVLREQPLVAIQHESNKRHAFACQHCFRYLGSVEAQVAARLLRRAAAPAAPPGAGGAAPPPDVAAEEEEGEADEEEGAPVDAAALRLAELADGSLTLPHSSAFPLPQPHACPGGCARRFCSPACAASAWGPGGHALLCPGPRSAAGQPAQLRSFYAHAARSNDVFCLAAALLARVAAAAEAALGGAAAAAAAPPAARARALRSAWAPFAVAHRLPWSQCVSLPADVARGGAAAAAEFRGQLSRLAGASLRRLRAALPAQASLFPPLFESNTFEQVVGLFELNNLDVVVESPVENYFLAIDDLPLGHERDAALAATQPLLDALDSEYSIALDGSGFYPLVACTNHSCEPNVASSKGAADVDGGAVLVATRDIMAGEEVCVCYIDAPPGTPLAQRREALADYGFLCACARCAAEEGREGARAELRARPGKCK